MPGRISRELAAAVAAAATIEVCPACAEPANSGLCHSDRCRRQVLPRGIKSPLGLDSHSGKYHETGKAALEDTAAVRKARRRDERKRQRREQRLATALAGGFSRVSARNAPRPVAA